MRASLSAIRVDTVTRVDTVRRGLAALALAGLLASALAGGVAAQYEDPSAGNGGVVNANAAGGTVNGNGAGNVDAGGGTVNANASGGDGNVAATDGGGCVWVYDPFTDLYYCV